MTKSALRTGDGPSVHELDKAQVRLEEQLKAIDCQQRFALERLDRGVAGAAQEIKELSKRTGNLELDVKGLMTKTEAKSEFRKVTITMCISAAGVLVSVASVLIAYFK